MAYRKFDTGTWEDKRFEKLSPIERYLFIYLWTNSKCNQAGMYEITLRRIEFETKLPINGGSIPLEQMLKGLAPLVQWWSTEEVVFIPNFLKRQCQNKQFAEGAIDIVFNKFPGKAQLFVNTNKMLFKKYKVDIPKMVEPTLNPPSSSTEAVTDTDTDTDKENPPTPQGGKSVSKKKSAASKIHSQIQSALFEKIKNNNLSCCQGKILEFFEYRMSLEKNRRYKTPKGVDALVGDVSACIAAGLDPVFCLDEAMRREWLTPKLDYFKNGSGAKNNGRFPNGTVMGSKRMDANVLACQQFINED